ncbi:MAG: hypothetical protein JO009_08745 [Candidatus Eremiobacteraeota bacterium]|nr:hypothetical protein [Candidatus Eremiobacteraeota bacterium]
MRLSLVFVMVVAAGLASCAKLNLTPPSANPSTFVPREIWHGESGGYRIMWSTADLIAFPQQSPGAQAFSELGRTIADFHGMLRTQRADCDLTRQADLQSVVGTIISIRTADTMKCTSGASGSSRSARSFDLAHPRQPLSLTSLFPAHELDALTTKAQHFCSSVPADLFNRFAFSEFHQQQVIVAVTLPQTCTTQQIDITLNVPAKLKQPLAQAAQRVHGFLWHDQPAISNGLSTTINYHYRAAVE